jgi:hypothetical protein
MSTTARSLSLFAVNLHHVAEAWRSHPRPPSFDEQRVKFDTLTEEMAEAWLWDVPSGPLVEAWKTIATIAKRPELELARLEEAAPHAYPPELLDAPFVERSDRRHGLVIWLSEPSVIGTAASAVERALALPAGSFKTQDPALWRDLLENLAPVLRAAGRAGYSLVAHRT